MSKKTLRAIILSGLAVVVAASDLLGAEQPAQLRITLEGYKSPRPERYIAGEPVPLRVTIENTSDHQVKLPSLPFEGRSTKIHIGGDVVAENCKLASLMYMGYLTPSTLEPRQRLTKYWDARSFGAVDTGEYEMWIEYDSSAESEDYLEREGIPVVRVESNRLGFEIVAPSGVDALVLEKFGHKECKSFPHERDFREKLASDFSTSTYTGWAMLHGEWPDQASPPEPGRGGGEGPWYHQEYSARLERMVRYLAARPDFDGADQMTFWIAWCRAYLGDKGQARGEVNTLLAKTDLPPWLRAECERLRDHLEQRAVAATPAPAHQGGVR